MNPEVAIADVQWSESLPVFCSDRFLRTISGDYGWVESLNEHGARRCILPFCVIRKGGLRLVRFTSQTVATGEDLTIDEEKAFLNAVVGVFRCNRADLIIPGTFSSLFRTYPDGAIAVPYGTYVVDLRPDESVLWQGVHPKHRNMVRSAERRGIRFRVAPDSLQIAATLVEESFERSASGLVDRLRLRWRSRRDSIVSEVVSLRENVAVLVAETQNQIHAAAIIPFSEPCAYYMHGGSASDALPGAMNLLQWEAMKVLQSPGRQVLQLRRCAARS